VQLHSKYPQQVATLTFNLDYAGISTESPESARDSVLKVLTKNRIRFQSIISSDPDEAVYQELDLGSVPAVLVYDHHGVLKKRFDNEQGEYGTEGFSYEQHVIPLVDELVANAGL